MSIGQRMGPNLLVGLMGATKYNLVQHLWACHNVTMEWGKPGRPSTCELGPKVQDHVVMNMWVLSNFLDGLHHNEQKAFAKARRHITLEWDRL